MGDFFITYVHSLRNKLSLEWNRGFAYKKARWTLYTILKIGYILFYDIVKPWEMDCFYS